MEAIKVALIRDRFFEFIEENAEALAGFESQTLEQVVRKSVPFTWITLLVRAIPLRRFCRP